MLYFAYGSNMDTEAMRALCPKSRALGLARLAKHRIFVMEEGYASVRAEASAIVHGVLYDLALSDVPALDRYEEVSRGLYRKVTQPVLRTGAAPVRALIYVGGSRMEAVPRPDYWPAILKAARDWALPQAYVSQLETLGGIPSVEAAPGARRAIKLKGI
ncbi:gamma-glutamylcyclotransferase family protein [Methyloferula stellata]|uniref:gamma-glutamylcyclotransferase family protein n=1 Tax=Methyloferula stellata TaxID=876270 RepID=UPI0003742152|nr:gamma-glutamylcyclotransferase family protein [Methyloferula stellata]